MVGGTVVARDFFAGLYAKVASSTFDSGATKNEDVAFVVGALAFLGRVEDAETCFEAWRMRVSVHDARTLAASRFFLGVAFARAGDFERSRQFLTGRIRHRLRQGDAWCAVFAHQGLACQRYFTGRYGNAARHALRALRAAHTSGFAYGKMLSTDLRGHALVQIGRFHAGIALLEQAKHHAEQLGFGMNAFAIECSIATYTARFTPSPTVVTQLKALLERPSHDSYSRHALLTHLAAQLSLRGRRTEALAAVEDAEQHALGIDGRRAKITSLLARLHVTRWSEGKEACKHVLERASLLANDADVAFRSALLGFEAWASSGAQRARAIAELASIASSRDLHAARAALEELGALECVQAFPEDQLAPLLRAIVAHDASALPRLIALGLFGAIPELLGLTPGQRIILLPTENAVFVEDRGDVLLRPNPPRWCPVLLRTLGAGDVSKEKIVSTLWGLRNYRPERHDPLIRTTIHRLRAFLGSHGDWIRVTTHGYGTNVPVVFAGAEGSPEAETSILADDEEPVVESDVPPTSPPPPMTTERRVLEALAMRPRASVREIARALETSQSTVLRTLRRLVAQKRVSRFGHARATRYESRG